LERIVQQMRAIEEPRLRDAQREAGTIRNLLTNGDALPASELIDRAEEIRQVANDMEGALRRHKEAAIAAGRAYLALKGARGWDDGSTSSARPVAPAAAEQSSESPPLPPGLSEAWLPPSPHREKVIDWLYRGRAALLTEEEASKIPVGPQGREPLVQFEDGGVMPLRAVRWSDEVSNFYPLGSPPPHPRGRLYRGRNSTPASV
ncbi:MAG TPA: hypothetical protein VGW38_27580, partial [Chloroflexota bacterium]|nr:hypothetical protein [Chloroflexota bacterium]